MRAHRDRRPDGPPTWLAWPRRAAWMPRRGARLGERAMKTLVPPAWALGGLRAEAAAATALIGRSLLTRTAAALLAFDLAFILVHLLEWSGAVASSERLRIDKDRSASEYFE